MRSFLFQVVDDALVGVRDGDGEPDLVGVDHMVTSHEIRSRQSGRRPEIMFYGLFSNSVRCRLTTECKTLELSGK